MKKLAAAIAFVFLFHQASYSQLTKGNWMVGGSGNFSTSSYTLAFYQTKSTTLSISPTIGYFIADRFPIGLRVILSNYNASDYNTTNGTTGQANNFGISAGPFVRYYFFRQVDRPVNVFVEGNYSYGYNTTIDRSKYYLNRFSFMAGPVIYLNNSVGLEFSIGYYYTQQYGLTTTGIQTGLGFQIHLEKEKYK
jgi:hypothetical protein